ncbi:MAG: spermidine synthase [Desulfobacteraceae bacterium]|uniref:Spermidine synthase n=1 Tax=Candidatus Desulfacyla euxinica TaxID=2841693 RepID=A0A8J6N525_9DELT|nr:spermidine synthase [Candidatus Desulfacyla euxinica]MBL6979135.1 spermidine synthase [Desulfobacteraceae bacterium]
MSQPWKIIDSVSTKEGILELRQRGISDFLITVGGRVLMNSMAHRSEAAMGRLACGYLKDRPGSRVLVGGLGMGFTLRAVLDTLPPAAEVAVAELNPAVLEWCRGPLAHLTDAATQDSRVRVKICDVALLIQEFAKGAKREKLDVVVLDLYTGPYARTHKKDDPIYGSTAIETTRTSLKPDGIFAVWGEDYDAGFEKRLRAAGFAVTIERLGRSGPRHVVYMGKLRLSRKKINRKGKEKGPRKR